MSFALTPAHDAAANARGAPAVALLPPPDGLADFGLRLARQFAQCRREGGRLALLWVEVDLRAAPVHPVDDGERHRLLQLASLRLRHRLRATDEVVRVSDHGFAALLLAAGAAEAELVEGRLRRALAGAYDVEGALAEVAVRVGKAAFPDHGRHSADLLQTAREQCDGLP